MQSSLSNGVLLAPGAGGVILRSTDDGLTWHTQYFAGGSTERLKAIGFKNVTHGIVVGTNGTILRTTNSGEYWIPQNSGTTKDLNGVAFLGGDTVVAVGDNATILRSTDGGESWTDLNIGGIYPTIINRTFLAVAGFGPKAIAVGSNGVVIRSTDFGLGWFDVDSLPNFTNLRAVTFLDNNTALALTKSGFKRTNNSGDTWGDVFISGTGGQVKNWHSFARWNSDSILIGAEFRMWRTTDTIGTNWYRWYVHRSTTFFGVTFLGNSSNAVAVGYAGIIIRTTDGGQNWIEVSNGAIGVYRALSFTDSRTGTIVGDNGSILRTTNAGATWLNQTRFSTHWDTTAPDHEDAFPRLAVCSFS